MANKTAQQTAAKPATAKSASVKQAARKETVLVTGAAGFIGSHAAQHLLARGYRVIALDNFCDFYERAFLAGA